MGFHALFQHFTHQALIIIACVAAKFFKLFFCVHAFTRVCVGGGV